MSTFRLGIAIPSGPQWYSDFGMCLLNMLLYLMQKPVPGYTANSVKVFVKRSSLLPKSRQELLQDCLDVGCSHALFIDTDQTFPANLVHMLARHGKHVIGCNVPVKTLPSVPTARNKHPEWPGGDVVYSNNKRGLEKVWRLGTGVMLINLSVLEGVPKPWFAVTYNEELKDFYGEDWTFCVNLEKAGVPIWVDHDASQAIGHIGTFTFEHQHVEVKEIGELAGEERRRQRLAG